VQAKHGASVASLPGQARGIARRHDAPALLAIGGNGPDRRPGRRQGPRHPRLRARARSVPASPADSPGPARHRLRPDLRRCARNFLGVAAKVARANHGRDNDVIARLAQRHGRLVDLHAHFLSGDPSWFAQTKEPSLIGASEVRRAFRAAL